MTEETQQRVWQQGSNTEGTEELLDAQRRGEVKYLKMDGGETKFKYTYLRLAPQHVNMERWFACYPQHFGLGPNRQVIGCARLLQEDECPACEWGFSLLDQKRDKEGKDILPSWRYYVNVIVLNQDGTPRVEEEGATPHIVIWSMGRRAFDLLKAQFDKYGDITHIETGRNLEVGRKGKGGQDTSYIIESAPEASPFPANLEVLDGVYDVTRIIKFIEAPAMQRLLAGGSVNTEDPLGQQKALPAPVESGTAPTTAAPTVVESTVVPAGGFARSEEEEGEGQGPTPNPSAQASSDAPAPTTDPSAALARLKGNLSK